MTYAQMMRRLDVEQYGHTYRTEHTVEQLDTPKLIAARRRALREALAAHETTERQSA